jgi:hypothetical protein
MASSLQPVGFYKWGWWIKSYLSGGTRLRSIGTLHERFAIRWRRGGCMQGKPEAVGRFFVPNCLHRPLRASSSTEHVSRFSMSQDETRRDETRRDETTVKQNSNQFRSVKPVWLIFDLSRTWFKFAYLRLELLLIVSSRLRSAQWRILFWAYIDSWIFHEREVCFDKIVQLP